MNSYNYKHMLKVGTDVTGVEGFRARFLKHDRNNVISDVSFTKQLQADKLKPRNSYQKRCEQSRKEIEELYIYKLALSLRY